MKLWARYAFAAALIAAAVWLFFGMAWIGLAEGGVLLLLATGLLRDPSSPLKVGPFQEADGAWSMRRCGAALLFTSSVGLFFLGGATDHAYAFYGGIACEVGGVVLLFFTTWADLSALVGAASGGLPLKATAGKDGAAPASGEGK